MAVIKRGPFLFTPGVRLPRVGSVGYYDRVIIDLLCAPTTTE